MGLSTKQVSSDVQDRSQGLLQSLSADSGSGSSMEFPKKRQQQQEQNLQQPPEKLMCPRCDSANTKFCYYNNYNKSQPRYFCKACKRHWTKGGMLRNVPVGGGKKNKRLKTSSNTTTSSTPKISSSFGAKNSHPRVSVDASDQRLNQAILGPKSLLQDSIFNSNMELCISSNESNLNSIFGGSSIPQNHDYEFPCPTSEYNFPCSIGLNNGALEETAMTLTGPDASLNCSSLWPSYESSSNWGWDEMDKFAISDIKTIPWDDDAEIN